MTSKTLSLSLLGLDVYIVEIETDLSNGLPAVNLVGLADAAVKESKERVRAAIKNSGFQWPDQRITISLAPSDIKKEGVGFDLAIAMGILASDGQINGETLKNYFFLGELSLDGQLRASRGILAMGLELSRLPGGNKNLIIPEENSREAAIIPGISVWAVKNLKEAVRFLAEPASLGPLKKEIAQIGKSSADYSLDFSEVKGQYYAKRALEVAVAGGHNIILLGPPGSGKTMLAKRIPTIMPKLSPTEALEITKIHSVAGILPKNEGFINTRPFRCPHHSISDIALIGGGSIPKPGEISLSHHGVLFLDELPEFNRKALEALRQPLEENLICVNRIKKTVVFPASFILVAALNPCPCGNYFNPHKKCHCSQTKIRNYLGRISGPLLDRIDLHIEVAQVRYRELSDTREAEPSQAIRQRVESARGIQKQRFSCEGISSNSQMTAKLIRKYCVLDKEARELIRMAVEEFSISARGYDKILKVGRTIGDLDGSQEIKAEHIAEAIQYRALDQKIPG